MGFTVDKEAERVAALSEEQLKDEVEAHFKQVYGGANLPEGAFRPTHLHICKWSQNPCAYGSYSYLRVNSFSQNVSFEHFQEPLDPAHLSDPISSPPGEDPQPASAYEGR